MKSPERTNEDKRRKRHALVYVSTAAAMAVALGVGMAGSLVDPALMSGWIVAPMVPALSVFMLISGLLWLAIETAPHRLQSRSGAPSGNSSR